MNINQTNLQNLYRGFRTIFMEAYQAAPSVEMVAGLSMEIPTMNAEEVIHWLGSFPGMKKLVDEAQIEDLAAHNWTVRVDEWEDTIRVKQADIERDRTGLYKPKFKSLGDIARQHDGEQVAQLLVNGFTEKCYTGKNFFDLNHEPIKKGTKFTNKGTKKLSAANYEAARAEMRNRLNAAGRAMNLGRELVLIVSPTYESTAKKILNAEKVDSGDTNVNKDTARLIVWSELTAAGNEHAWFLADFGQPVKPLIILKEKETDLLAADDPNDSRTIIKHEFLYQAYKRMGYGYGLPELMWGSTGADAA